MNDAPKVTRTPKEHERLMEALREDNERRIVLSQTPVAMPPFAGKEIGQGGNRVVYEHAENPAWVVKVARNLGNANANSGEWHHYVLLDRLGMRNWLAPCVECAKDGSWLVMERTEPLTEPVEIDLPWLLSFDTKLRNWGRLRGRIVCHDYQTLTTEHLRQILAKTSRHTLEHG